MIGAERRNIILEKLQEEKKVVVSELSGLFEVSEETIRRDLDRLDKEGLAVKSYGGATLPENNSSVDMPFMVRQKKNMVGKRKIAKLLAEIINDGDHIKGLYLDCDVRLQEMPDTNGKPLLRLIIPDKQNRWPENADYPYNLQSFATPLLYAMKDYNGEEASS